MAPRSVREPPQVDSPDKVAASIFVVRDHDGSQPGIFFGSQTIPTPHHRIRISKMLLCDFWYRPIDRVVPWATRTRRCLMYWAIPCPRRIVQRDWATVAQAIEQSIAPWRWEQG